MGKRDLDRIALGSMLAFFGLLAALLFGFAGTLRYWQGWLFCLSFCAPTAGITLYFLRRDPELVRRRVRPTETRPRQQAVQSAAAVLFFLGLIALPALDHRLGWSAVPGWVSCGADALTAAGFGVVFFVFRENPFASRAVERMADQRTVTTGPYAVVRHPMYSGAALVILSAPVALGSVWGLAVSGLLLGLIAVRLLDEEAYLKEQLPGYREYCAVRRYRLVPFLW
jgi:protein-S-isoprenylcysteine O-methyltransferase Ste14